MARAAFNADFTGGNDLTMVNPLPTIPKTVSAIEIAAAGANNDFVFDRAASTDVSLKFHATGGVFLVTIDTDPINDLETFAA